MSSDAILSPARSGVYRAPADVSKLRAQARACGAAWFEIGTKAAPDKASLMADIAQALHFPSTFGTNWDALADALQDLSWHPAAGYVLHVRHANAVRQALASDWGTLLEVLQTTATYWAARGTPFVVVIDGAGELQPWT
jgi:RNAse (barnase) inhibitor barstar